MNKKPSYSCLCEFVLIQDFYWFLILFRVRQAFVDSKLYGFNVVQGLDNYRED